MQRSKEAKKKIEEFAQKLEWKSLWKVYDYKKLTYNANLFSFNLTFNADEDALPLLQKVTDKNGQEYFNFTRAIIG